MNTYLEIAEKYQEQLLQLKKKKQLISNVRILAFIFTCLLFYFYITSNNVWYLAFTLLAFTLFMVLVSKSATLTHKINHIIQALLVVEAIKQDDTFDEFPANNQYFSDNIYNRDLDILEGQSLFNRINKTQSFVGNFQLKNFLSNVILTKSEILKRQAAFAELSQKTTWVVKFLTYSKLTKLNGFEIFGHQNPQFRNQSLRYLPIILGLINILTFGYLAYLGFPKKAVFFWVVIAIPLGFIINILFKNKINKSLSFAFIKADQLDSLIHLLMHTEQEDFTQELNLVTKNGLFNNRVPASSQLKGIKSTMDGFSALGIPILGFLLNNFTLWKLYHTIQLEHKVGNAIDNNRNWIVNLSIFEAFISFAIFNDKFKEFSTPIVADQPLQLDLQQAYHPLLATSIAVKNNFLSNTTNSIAIITGANMAGKSTFLRTIGTNLVLAMNGANVSAEKMIFYPMDIFTSIRTADNLSTGDSYFKNEINKLKLLIDRLDQNLPQYIILDEILKGTNSKDKLIGSQKFLEKLMHHPTNLMCLIATHDLELTKLEDQYPNFVTNYCFELKNKGEHYFSDYKLRQGTTEIMNAIYLMKQFNIIN